MSLFTDQLGRRLTIDQTPKRIISLVPSQTELLYDLGLRDEVAGITRFCIHPGEWHTHKHRIGGTKNIDIEKIHYLKPDLVIGNKEENDQAQIEELMKHYPVWMSDVDDLPKALDMISSLGAITGKSATAYQLIKNIEDRFLRLQMQLQGFNWYQSVYLIWEEPFMTVGHDTFINDLLLRCHFKNVFDDKIRYPEISESDLIASDPDLILLSSEPYPFSQKHRAKFKSLCPRSKVVCAEAEFFSWYGSRLLKAPDYFRILVEQIHAGD